jgi:hypothetical protein
MLHIVGTKNSLSNPTEKRILNWNALEIQPRHSKFSHACRISPFEAIFVAVKCQRHSFLQTLVSLQFICVNLPQKMAGNNQIWLENGVLPKKSVDFMRGITPVK